MLYVVRETIFHIFFGSSFFLLIFFDAQLFVFRGINNEQQNNNEVKDYRLECLYSIIVSKNVHQLALNQRFFLQKFKFCSFHKIWCS